MIKIHLNGELREVPENLNLAALLEWLKMPLDRVAVERNRQVTPRSAWSETIILPDDELEVVHFVGGGMDTSPQLIANSWKTTPLSPPAGEK